MATKQTVKPATGAASVEVNTTRPLHLEIQRIDVRQGFSFTITADKSEGNPEGHYHFKDMQAINLLKRMGMVQTEALSGAKTIEKLTLRDKVVLKSAAVRFSNAVNASVEPCYINATEVYGIAGESIVDINSGEVLDTVYKNTGWRALSAQIEFSGEVSNAFQLSNERFEIALLTAEQPAAKVEDSAPQIG